MGWNKEKRVLPKTSNRYKARWYDASVVKRCLHWIGNNRLVRIGLFVGVGECLITLGYVERETIATWLGWFV